MKSAAPFSYTEAFEQYGFIIRPFKGHSMLPLLVEGRDDVRLVPPAGRLKKYDIALFLRPNGDYVLHRVIRVLDDSYYIRGDNCLKYETVQDSQIIGVAEGVYINGTYHSCSEKKIANYALRQKFTLPFRVAKSYIKYFFSRVYMKIFRRNK